MTSENKAHITFIISLIIMLIGLIMFVKGYSTKQTNISSDTITVTDTVVVTKNIFVNVEDKETIDSLKLVISEKDTTINLLSNKILVKDYKLQRIKEYNRIAGQRNNIKFLRGWINRVLKDE